MPNLFNLARMSTATAGTGAITLGSAVTGFLSFAGAGVSNGDVVYYAIRDGAHSEIGYGTYTTSGTTLTRNVLKSTNSDTPISLSGTAEVFLTPPAEILREATDSLAGRIEHANDSEVRAATTGNLAVTPATIESASALVALTDAATVAVNWDAFINASLTVTANRAIGNPSNGQPGTFRTILVQGASATDRTITFGNQFLGEVPTITDCDDARWYLLTIFCVTASHFVVSSKKAKGT